MAGSWRARVMAMMCRALLSWRSPPRSSRWRWRWPEEHGIGAVPAWRAKLASLGKRSAPAVRPISSAAVRAPQPVSASSCGRCALTRASSSRSSASTWRVSARMCASCSRATRTRAQAGMRRRRRSIRSSWRGLSSEPRLSERSSSGESSSRCQRNRFCDPGALGDEVLAVIGEQPDLHRSLVEVGGGEALHAVLDDGPSDGERVDLVRLAGLALAAPRGAHPLRRHPHDPLAGRDQRLLEPARDVAAVLDRPHPLLVEPARPAHRGQMPRLLGLDLPGAAHPAGSRVHRRQRVRALVRVRSDHDHLHRPFVWLSTDEADLRRTALTRGDATLLSGHAEGPRAAAGDITFPGQTGRRQRL